MSVVETALFGLLRSIKDILIRKKISKISNNPIDHLHHHQQGRAAAGAAAEGDGGRGGGGQGGESQGDDSGVGGQDFGDNRDDFGVKTPRSQCGNENLEHGDQWNLVIVVQVIAAEGEQKASQALREVGIYK